MELVPLSAPKPIDRKFIIGDFVDTDFARDSLVMRSRTGFLVIVNHPKFNFKEINFQCGISICT